jgi:hypothetical protein
MQQGADDYILKTNLTRLPAAISKAIEKKRMRKENEMEKQLSGSIINSLPGVFYFYNGRGIFFAGIRILKSYPGILLMK